jgi:hypothetical protein
MSLRNYWLFLTPVLLSFHSNARVQASKPNTRDTTSPLCVGKALQALKQPYYPPNANCVDYMVPIDITYNNYEFNGTKFLNDYNLTDFLTIATTRAGANYPSPLDGPIASNGSFNIAASFCTPKNETPKSKHVIIATHGIGPARAHWNPQYQPDEHNFVQYAIGQGYSVFFYDRLGCGASDKYDPFIHS